MNYIKRVYSGRIGRKNYILGYLILALFFTIALTILIILAATLFILSPNAPKLALVVYILFVLTYQFYGISLAVRRLHDLNKSSWFFLFILIPLINIYWAILLLFKKGEEGENKYGVLDKDAKIIKTVFGF